MTDRRRMPSLMGTTRAKSPKGANLTVFGAPHGTPYKSVDNRVHQKAADSFRMALRSDASWLDNWDFDFGGKLIADETFKAVDLGNLATKPKDGLGNRKKIEATTRAILDAGAVPLMFGGDDSTPIPFLAGFAGGPAITVVQIDAHIDWREEREGERYGFSSTMRRTSEMNHVWRIVQAGARGLGSARKAEVDDAMSWGARLVSCKTIHHEGAAAVLQHIEADSVCVICLDLDVLDSSVMPAVAYPTPGGLSFVQLTDLISDIASKATIGGFAMVEFVPKRDFTGMAAFTAARIAMHIISHIVRRRRLSSR